MTDYYTYIAENYVLVYDVENLGSVRSCKVRNQKKTT